MIKYRVYLYSAEIKLNKRRGSRGINSPEDLTEEIIQSELLDDPSPILRAEFDTEEEAVTYASKCWPVFDIGHVGGYGVKYIPVAGAWIEEYDGNEYVGTVWTSGMPKPDEE